MTADDRDMKLCRPVIDRMFENEFEKRKEARR